MCSGTTRGRVLNGEVNTQRLQKLIYPHIFTNCFKKISPRTLCVFRRIEEKSSLNSL